MRIVIDCATGEETVTNEVVDIPYDNAHTPELTDIEKLKIRQDATENAVLFLMDMGGML